MWEYAHLISDGNTDASDSPIRAFGRDGWELVAVLPFPASGGVRFSMFFKRRVMI